MSVLAVDIPPPPYTEKDLVTRIDAIGEKLSTEDQHKVDQKIVDQSHTPEFRTEIKAEVENLAQTVVAIENDFARIQEYVSDLDKKELLQNKFRPRWAELHEKYTHLLTNSQTTANQMKEKIASLTQDLIPILSNEEYELKDKKDELKGYVESLATFETTAKETEHDFLRLIQDIQAFQNDLHKEAADAVEENKHQIQELEAKIVNLKAELEKCSGFFTRCWDAVRSGVGSSVKTVAGLGAAAGAIGGGTAVTGLAALPGLAAIAPVACVGLLVAGIGALGLNIFSAAKNNTKHIEDIQNQIRDNNRQLEGLKYKAQQLVIVQQELITLDQTFASLVTKLTSMQQIWRLLITDAQSLEYILEDMTKDSTKKLMFKQKANRIGGLWETFYFVLDKYSLAVPNARAQ